MKMKISRYDLLLHLLMLMFSCSGICSKKASAEAFLSVRWILFYGTVLVIMGVYALLWQQILKHVPLGKAYSCKAMTVVWGMLWGVLIFGEQLHLKNLIGGGLVIAGVLLVLSGNENHEPTD